MSSNLVNVAEIYHKHPKLNKEDVGQVSEWLQTQPHLPDLAELQVMLFLHSCYYDIEATKKTIENYFAIRASSDYFRSGDEALIRRTLSVCFTTVLPKKTPEGYCIWAFSILDPKLELYNFSEFTKMSIMAISLYFHQFGPADGLVLLADLHNFSLGHLFKMSPNAVRIILQFLQEAIPTRIKGIHMVNVGPSTKSLIAMAKPFMRKEVYEMIRLHRGSFQNLYQFIPRECLPKEYGGYGDPIKDLHGKNLENLLEHLDFFKWHDEQKIDETKMVGKKEKGLLKSWLFGKSS